MLKEVAIDKSVAVRPDDHLTYLMAKVGHLLERRVDEAVGQAGLTLRQFSALAHIARRPGLSSSDLARVLLTTPQAVNTLVARLMAAGLIEKAPSRSRQPLVLTITDVGAEALQRAVPLATRAEAAALATLQQDELTATRRTLERLLDHLGDRNDTRP
jgi:DNA-binding MarR family transcriptional regulator